MENKNTLISIIGGLAVATAFYSGYFFMGSQDLKKPLKQQEVVLKYNDDLIEDREEVKDISHKTLEKIHLYNQQKLTDEELKIEIQELLKKTSRYGYLFESGKFSNTYLKILKSRIVEDYIYVNKLWREDEI